MTIRLGCETAERQEGAFRSVAKPAALLPGPLVAHAVEPADPRTVYLADAHTVAASSDSGCTWKLVLHVPAAGITSLAVPDSGATTGRLLVVATAKTLGTGVVGDTSVVWSRRGPGQAFVQSSPLPGIVKLAIAPGDPQVVYAATDDVSQVAAAPLRSTDGGATFLPATGTRSDDSGGRPGADGAPRTVAVDPAAAGRFLVGSDSLQRSNDSGARFATVLNQPQVVHAHIVGMHPAGPVAGDAVLLATGQSTSSLAEDSAQVWSVPAQGAPVALPRRGLVGIPDSVALGRTSEEVAITGVSLPPGFTDGYDGPGALLLYDAPRRTWVDVIDGRGYPLLGALADRRPNPALHLHSSSLSSPPGADEYVVYDPPSADRIVPPTVDAGAGVGANPVVPGFPLAPRACPDAAVFSPPVVRRSASQLTPAAATLPVAADGTATQDVVLDLAGDVRALDLDLLLDTSDSMGPAAAGIVCGLEELVSGLAAEGVDVHIGLGEFWDSGPGQRYRRLVPLGPPDRPLQRALRSVRTRGGEETHRTALVQSVTGRGLTVNGTELVTPGQGAHYRDGALRVVLLVTDEPWTATTPGEPSPLEVIDVLNAAGVRHVALQVLANKATTGAGGDRAGGLAASALLRTQLDQFSAGTGALAPVGGVDCDGDGTSDLREGDPLVCTGTVTGGAVPVGAPVRALLDALQSRGPVVLRATAPAGVTAHSTRTYSNVDLLQPARLVFPLTVDCGSANAPAAVALEALAGGARVATAVTTVRCEPPRGAAAGPTPAAAASDPIVPAGADAPARAVAVAPPGVPPPAAQVPAAAAQPAAGTAGASAGAAAALPAPAVGLAGAPGEATARRRALVSLGDGALPLEAVPLLGGALAVAAATAALLASRRAPSRPAYVPTYRPTTRARRPEDLR